MSLSFTIPGKTKNTLNHREHRMAQARRAKAERGKALLLCPKWKDGPVLMVTLTRFGREMDDDGLRAALKHIRDGVAARLRVDDGSPLVEWRYLWEPCAVGAERVRVDVVRVE